MDKVAVLIPTFQRKNILHQTILNLERFMNISSQYSLYYIIGCNGQKNKHVLSQTERLQRVFVVETEKDGLGANLNSLINFAKENHYEFLFQMDDDHQLKIKLDLTRHIKELKSNKNIGWIRFYGCGFHNMVADQDGRYWVIRWNDENNITNGYCAYPVSNRPHLKLTRFHNIFGMYKEGQNLGDTEEPFQYQCRNIAKNNKAVPRVAVPMDFDTEEGWDHVGESWQLKGY